MFGKFFSLSLSLICLLYSFFCVISYYRRNFKRTDIPKPAPVQPIQKPKSISNPSSLFAKQVDFHEQTLIDQSSINFFKQYVQADRPSSEAYTSKYESRTTYDQHFNESLKRIVVTSPLFHKYLTNFKNFVCSKILSKFVLKLNSDEPVVENMIAVPSFEHCRSYIIQRIRSLLSSQLLAGHFGNRGAQWYDREWTAELPSDNQIVLHIICTWVSFLMNGKKQ